MGIFGKIVSAIFGGADAAESGGQGSTGAPPSPNATSPSGSGQRTAGSGAVIGGGAPAAALSSGTVGSAAPGGATTAAGSSSGATGGAARPQPISRDQVEAKIEQIAKSKGHTDYKWRTSIVDLMKLLDIDSGLKAREDLAKELGYTGALDGSAEMNVWLHKQVMAKLAESGGAVPDSLR